SYDPFKTSNGNACLFINLSCLFISYSPFVFSVSVCFHICSQFICLQETEILCENGFITVKNSSLQKACNPSCLYTDLEWLLPVVSFLLQLSLACIVCSHWL
uniref:Uncharacterized protein n=1 Tax=Sinocyclocheilus anshuiensis TaxID=1608454 RepID=A0A671LVE2_9TELE